MLEFAVQYVKTNGETVVGIRGKDSVVVCGQKKVQVGVRRDLRIN